MIRRYISGYTPNISDPKDLEAVLVQRKNIATRIVDLIRQSVLTPSKYQQLIVGPRGLGKTFLVSIIQNRIAVMEDIKDRLLTVRFAEDNLGAVSFLDLLLRLLRDLKKDPSIKLSEDLDSLFDLSPDIAEASACDMLEKAVGDRTLLIIVENLQDLFSAMGKDGQTRLRALMQEKRFIVFLATTNHLFDGVSLQTSPFYGTFSLYHLEKLKFDDAVNLIINIASLKGDDALSDFIRTDTGRARIQSFAHIADGNHRFFTLFAHLLSMKSLEELTELILITIDELSPYYHSRISVLPFQQRKIMEFLCSHRAAAPVKEIAKQCFLKHQVVSSQLKLLKEKRYVRVTPMGRDSYYELFDNIMRLWVEIKKDSGATLKQLLGFLKTWYSPGDSDKTVTTVLLSAGGPGLWEKELSNLVAKHAQDNTIQILANNMVLSLVSLKGEMVSGAARLKWIEAWEKAAGKFNEFHTPLRIMKATVEYLNTHNPRALLGISKEERAIPVKLLDIQDHVLSNDTGGL